MSASSSVVSDGLARASPFDLSGRTVLLTGGGSGIGLAFVDQFVKYGVKTVVITGRREDVLKDAQKKHPNHVEYIVSDAGSESDRISLFEIASKKYPELSVLVNNAGIQRRIALPEDKADWKEKQTELDINLSAPIHLSHLFAPLLLKQKNGAAIIHVTSGLAFVPFVAGPIYSATKAALHSFTLSQRISFEGSPVRVVEIIPPAVRSNLGGSHDFGEDPVEFSDSVFARWTAGELEVGFKLSETWRLAKREELLKTALQYANHFKAPRYQAQS